MTSCLCSSSRRSSLWSDSGPQHAAFSRTLHREMTALLASTPLTKHMKTRSSSTVNLSDDGSSEPPTPMFERDADEPKSPKPTLFGGIMVSQEIAISVVETSGDEKLGAMTRIRGKIAPAALPSKKASNSEKPGLAVADPSIEMGRVTTPTTGFHGGGVGKSDVAGGNTTETAETTYVDEIFASCIERRT